MIFHSFSTSDDRKHRQTTIIQEYVFIFSSKISVIGDTLICERIRDKNSTNLSTSVKPDAIGVLVQ